jgi:hypothetical protein
MHRYLPEKAWDKLTPGQKAATNKKKVEAAIDAIVAPEGNLNVDFFAW